MTQPLSSPPAGLARHIWIAGLLGNLHDAGVAIATCVSGLDPQRFHAAAATQRQALRALDAMRRASAGLPREFRPALGTIDWDAWEALAGSMPPVTPADRDAVWDAMTLLVPAMLLALRRLRRQSPELFNPAGFRA